MMQLTFGPESLPISKQVGQAKGPQNSKCRENIYMASPSLRGLPTCIFLAPVLLESTCFSLLFTALADNSVPLQCFMNVLLTDLDTNVLSENQQSFDLACRTCVQRVC